MEPALLDTSKLIVGASGSGKTVTAKHEVAQLLDQRRHVAIIDPTGVWWGMRSTPDGEGRGYDLPIFGGDHGDLPIRPGQGEAIARLVLEQRVSAIIDLSAIDNSADWRRFMADFVATLRKLVRSNFHLVMDEADEFAAENPSDASGFALRENLVWIAKRGRVHGFVPTWITQRPADIAKAVTSQAQTLIAHQLILAHDQKAIDGYLAAKGSAGPRKEVMGSLAELAIGERWVYSPRLKLLDRGVTAPLSTFDSSATPAPGEAPLQPRTLAELDVSAIAAALATPLSIEQETGGTPRSVGDHDGDLARLERQLAAVAAERDETEADLAAANQTITAARQVAENITRDVAKLIALIEGWPAGPAADEHVADEPEVVPHEMAAPSPAPAPDRLATADTAVTPAQQRILDQLAWAAEAFHKPAIERQVLAIVLGAHPRTKSYLNNLGALRTAGLIDYPTTSTVALTAAGVDQAARPDIAGATVAMLRDSVAAWLPPAQRRIFKLVVASWPKGMDRDRLAAAIGTHPRTKSLLNNIGRLKTLGLLTAPTSATLRAAPYLFGKDR